MTALLRKVSPAYNFYMVTSIHLVVLRWNGMTSLSWLVMNITPESPYRVRGWDLLKVMRASVGGNGEICWR